MSVVLVVSGEVCIGEIREQPTRPRPLSLLTPHAKLQKLIRGGLSNMSQAIFQLAARRTSFKECQQLARPFRLIAARGNRNA